jgi:hypothetical protein
MDDEQFGEFSKEIENLREFDEGEYKRELEKLGGTVDRYEEEIGRLKRELEELRKSNTLLKKANEEKEYEITRFKTVLGSISEKIKEIITFLRDKELFIEDKDKRKNKEKVGKSQIANTVETDSESDSSGKYAGVSSPVQLFSGDVMNGLETLKRCVLDMVNKLDVLKFEMGKYGTEIVQDHVNFNNSKKIIKDGIGKLLPSWSRPFWNIFVDIFSEQFLFLSLKDLLSWLSHVIFTITIIGYIHYYSSVTLYCTIA